MQDLDDIVDPGVRRRGDDWLGDSVGVGVGQGGYRPALGRLPWFALLRLALILRLFVFLDIQSGYPPPGGAPTRPAVA